MLKGLRINPLVFCSNCKVVKQLMAHEMLLSRITSIRANGRRHICSFKLYFKPSSGAGSGVRKLHVYQLIFFSCTYYFDDVRSLNSLLD